MSGLLCFCMFPFLVTSAFSQSRVGCLCLLSPQSLSLYLCQRPGSELEMTKVLRGSTLVSWSHDWIFRLFCGIGCLQLRCVSCTEVHRGVPAGWREPVQDEGDEIPMIAAFNSINVFKPHGINPAWRTTSTPWFHIDNPKPDPGIPINKQKVVFEGIVNLVDVSADTGGFCCVPKSHLQYGQQVGKEGQYLDVTRYTSFIDSEPNERTGNKSYTQPVMLCTGGVRGTLVLWDPRLAHCSSSSLTPDSANQRAKEPRVLRLAGFLSMCPKAWATPADIAARLKVVEDRMCINTHVPHCVGSRRADLSALKKRPRESLRLRQRSVYPPR